MTFKVSPHQIDGLKQELADSHQVVITAGTIATTDGRIAADYTYDGAGTLTVTLTKHEGYMGFVAEAGLKSKLNAALKALPE